MILQKRKKLVITGRSDRDMYINARKQLGKDRFMNTWQVSERCIILLIKKPNENQYQRCGNDKRRRGKSWKVENWNYREYFLRIAIMQSDQSECVPGRALLKDKFSCCIQRSLTVTQEQLPATLKMTKH